MAYFSALIILSLCALGIQAQKQESCQYSVTVPRSHLVPVGDCSATPMGPLESIKAEITELVHRENSRLEDQVRSMREALLNLTAILMAAHSTPNCPGEPASNENTTRPRPVPNVVIAATHGCSQQCREAIDTCLAKTENITATECIVTCPNITCQNGEGRSVWGTDLYTDDSSICRSAVHAGVIGASGGVFKVIKARGLSSYVASTRNGISTHGYGSWSGSCRYEAV